MFAEPSAHRGAAWIIRVGQREIHTTIVIPSA